MPSERRGAVGLVPLAGGEHRRHDHGAGMDRAALEGVVEILAMRRRAVDEGGAGRAQRARVADRRARPVVVPAVERAFDIILVARGDAEADHVDQQILAFRRTAAGRRADRRQIVRPALGDGDAGTFVMRTQLVLADWKDLEVRRQPLQAPGSRPGHARSQGQDPELSLSVSQAHAAAKAGDTVDER